MRGALSNEGQGHGRPEVIGQGRGVDPVHHEGGGDGEDRVEFDEAWEHRGTVRDLCQRIVGDWSTADDLVQETYLRTLRNLDRLERRQSIVPWLATVARRRSLNELRRRRHVNLVDAVPERSVAPEVDPAEVVVVSDEVDRVREALQVLTPREHDLLVRQVYQGLSLAELAEEEHSTVASVRSVLNRARSKLRDALAESGHRVLAPVALLGAWMRRRIAPAVTRLHQATPAPIGAYERLGEMLTAAIVAITLGAGGAAVPGVGPRPPAPRLAALGTPGGFGAAARPAATSPTAAPVPAPSAPSRPAGEHPDAAPGLPTTPLPVDPGNPLQEPSQPDQADVQQIAASRDGRDVFALGHAHNRPCALECTPVLFHSPDGGATWERLGAVGFAADTLLVPPAYPQDRRLFGAGATGLEASSDGGQTFTLVPKAPAGGPAAMAPGFSSGDARIVIGSTPAWQYDADRDDGRPFSGAPVTSSPIRFAFAPDYASSGRLFAGAAVVEGGALHEAVFRCSRGAVGDVCDDKVVLDRLTSEPRVAVSSRYSLDRIVLAWGDGGLYRSSDAGATFQPVDLPPGSHVTGVTDDGAGTFFVSLFIGDTSGTRGGVLVSRDGARTWVLRGAGTPLAQGTATVHALAGGALLAAPLASAGGGLWCSRDAGLTWATRCAR